MKLGKGKGHDTKNKHSESGKPARAVRGGYRSTSEPIETSVGVAGERITQVIRDLRSKAGAIREQIRAVEKAGASNWGRLKNTADEGLKDLGRAIDNAIESLRKTGSGGG